MTPIPWGGSYEQVDLVAAPVTRGEDGACNGGVIFVEAELLGLTIDPIDGGTGTDCDQSGGFRTLLLVAKDSNGRVLVMCPFVGVRGQIGCSFSLTCCMWAIVETLISCTEEGGSASIQYSATLGGECECVPTGTITIDGTDYPLIPPATDIEHEVTPCSPGLTTIDVTTTITYPEGECQVSCQNSTVLRHVTL